MIRVSRPYHSVVRVEAKSEDFPDGFHLLIRGDAHCDSPENDWKTEKSHLDHAVSKGAYIVDTGDLFDAMQGRGDPRADPADLLPELKDTPYADRLVEFARRRYIDYAKNWLIMGEGNHECLSPAHDVLTRAGWKPIAEVTNEDIVATLNPQTRELEYSRPFHVHSYWYTGKMLRYSGKTLSMEMTPNHRVAYYRPRETRLRYEVASEMLGTACSRLIPTSGVYQGGEYERLSDDEIRFAAWVLTDGSIHKNRLVIYQSKPAMVSRIRQMLTDLGLQFCEKSRQRSTTHIMGRELKTAPLLAHEFTVAVESSALMVSKLGLVDKTTLPTWVRQLSQRQFDLFFDELILGDGSRKKEAPTAMMMYGTKEFLENLQIELIHHGYRAFLSQRERSSGVGYPCLNVSRRDKIALQTRMLEEYDYAGRVYCITTQHGNFVTRHKGCAFVTGNSKFAKHYGTALTERLAAHLRAVGSPVETVRYDSTLVICLSQRQVRRRFVVKLLHGSGGASKATGGSGKAKHRAAVFHDADVVCSGHIHTPLIRPLSVERINRQYKPEYCEQLHLQVAGYKNTTARDHGWEVEREFDRTLPGAYILSFYRDGSEDFDFVEQRLK